MVVLMRVGIIEEVIDVIIIFGIVFLILLWHY
jgi:hypothetical protein